jgi:transglutaminase-like putative cysteine protease
VPPSKNITIGQKPMLAPPGLASSTQVSQARTTIKLDHLVGSSPGYNFPVFFLPVPYWPVDLSLPGSWSESYNTLMVYSGSADHSGMQYVATNGEPLLTKAIENSAQPIPASIRKSYLGFSSSVTPRLTAIARTVTKNATTPFEKAVALEDYFQSGGHFTYTLHGPALPNTARGLLDFLTTSKQGFCEQFAFAMAALARLLGIPSRIAIGYTGGTEHAGHVWQVTTADAHSWPELYFPQVGWLRFEPTPGGPHGQGTASPPSYVTSSASVGPGGDNGIPPITPKTGTLRGVDQKGVSDVRAPQPGQVGTDRSFRAPASRSHAPIGQLLLGLLALLLVAAAIPGTTRIVGRRRRWRAAAGDSGLASAAWQEVCADLDDFGLTRRLSESPRATARRISVDANIDEAARQAINRIAIVVERCRYAPVPASADGIRADVTEVRRSLARSATILQRLRARLMPASVIAPTFGSVRQAVGQRTGWVPSPIHS